MPNLAWIGLGNMGIAMAKNLADSIKPQELKVFNRTRSRSEELAKESSAIIEVCDSIGELVQGSDIIFICLADDKAVTSTIDSVLESGNLNGKLVCDMSSK